MSNVLPQYRPFSAIYFLLTALLSIAACSSDGALAPQERQLAPEQAGLDIGIRTESDRSWDGGLTAADISWRFISFSDLRRGIALVGSFKSTFINANSDRELDFNMRLVFVSADGEDHLAQTPATFVHIPVKDSTAVRENFIVEVGNVQTANTMARMNIEIF